MPMAIRITPPKMLALPASLVPNFFPMALVASLLIAAITFVICFGGIAIGKKFGTKLAGKASIFGGVILIAIGIEIFLTGVL